MINVSTLLVVVYGLFVLVGGIIGYVKAKSKASLVTGVLAGVVLLLCAYGMTEGIRIAYLVSVVVAIVLGVRFFQTWLTKRRLFPDLAMVILSALTFLFVGLRLLAS